MGVTATTSEEISVGAGEIFYRDVGSSAAWSSLGATQDENVFRLIQEFFAPQFNGVVGRLTMTDYLQNEVVELEVAPSEVSAALSEIVIPGSEVTTPGAVGAVGGGATGDLSAAISAGQWTAIKVSSVTNLAVGNWIRVGTTPNREIRQVVRVGTVDVGGTGIDVNFPFALDHPDTETWEEVDGSGETVISGGPQRRIPSTSYHDFMLVVPGLDGRATRFMVYNALALGDKEWAASDDDNMRPRITVTGARAGATPSRSAWDIIKVPAVS